MSKTLGEIVTIKKGKKHSISNEVSNKSCRYIQIEDLRNNLNLKYTDDEHGIQAINKDLIIAWDGANAGTIGYNLNGKIGSTLARLRLKDNVDTDPVFLGKYLESKFQYLRKTATGATIPHINRKALEKIKIPKINSFDQKKIAQVLSDCEDLIAKRKESIRLLEDLIQSTFSELFGKIFSGNLKALNPYLEVQQGYAFKSKNFQKSGIPVIKIGTVNKGFFDTSTLSYLPEDYLTKFNRFKITKGDLLISMTGTVGKDDYGNTCFCDSTFSNYLLNQRVGKLVVDDKSLHLTFVHHLFQTPRIKKQLIKANRGVRQANISSKDIANIEINIPDLKEQLKFAEIVNTIENLKVTFQNHLLQLENLYSRISQDAFKGNLNLNKLKLKITEFPTIYSFNIEESKVSVEKPSKKPLSKEKLAQVILSSFGKNEFSIETLRRLVSEKYENQSREELKSLLKVLLESNKIEQTYNQKEKQIKFRIANEA